MPDDEMDYLPIPHILLLVGYFIVQVSIDILYKYVSSLVASYIIMKMESDLKFLQRVH